MRMRWISGGVFALLAAGSPALAQTPQQVQLESDRYLQSQTDSLTRSMTQQQLGQMQDQQRRDQLFATQPPVFQQQPFQPPVIYQAPQPPVFIPPAN